MFPHLVALLPLLLPLLPISILSQQNGTAQNDTTISTTWSPFQFENTTCPLGYGPGFFPTCFEGGICVVRGDICIRGQCCRPRDLDGCPVGTWPNGRCRNTEKCKDSCFNNRCCFGVGWI